MKNLTNAQRDELIERFTEVVVDNMSTESLVCYAQEMMADYHDKLSDHELIETIDCYDPDLYNQLVDNVTSDNKPAESNKNLSEIAPVSSYATPENKVIRYQEMTHDSEGC